MSESAKLIPEEYHSINPYLVVRNAERAIEFYKKAFGAEEPTIIKKTREKCSNK